MDSKFRIKEYCKYIMPFFNGYGMVLHEITGRKIGSEPLAIDHSFGADEGLHPLVNLGGIKEAQKLFFSNKQPERSTEYSFNVTSKHIFCDINAIKEISTNKPHKIFRLFWDLAFGLIQEAKYIWVWLSPVMYSAYHKKDTQHSLLKIDYPTKILIFKAIFHRFYPINTNPELIMVQDDGKEQYLGTLKEVDFHKEKMGFNFEQRGDCRCYTATVKNPRVGQIYKVVWKIGYEGVAKYLGSKTHKSR